MIIAVCDPKGIAIEAIKTILYHDKGLSDRISRIYEFWNMEQLLDASRDSSFDCIVFPNYCNSHNSVVCSLSCGYNRFPLVEHDPRYTLIVRDILYWETARSLWTQYLKAIPGKEEKVKRAIRGILADYEKEERDIIYLESKNHCVLVHLDGIRQTPEGSPSFYATLDEAEHEFASSAFLRIHKSYLINGDHIIDTNLSCHSISVVITASRTALTGSMVHEKMEMAAVSVMKKRLTFKSRFSRSALRFVSRTRASIFRWNFSEGWKSSFISSKLGIRASSRSCASVTIIAIRASGEIRILSSFITIFLQSGQNDFTRSVQTNFYISGRNVEKIGNLADLVALNF